MELSPLDGELEADACRCRLAVAAIGNLEPGNTPGADQLINTCTVRMGITMEIFFTLPDNLVNGSHGISIDGKATDRNMTTVSDISGDCLLECHDFFVIGIHLYNSLMDATYALSYRCNIECNRNANNKEICIFLLLQE